MDITKLKELILNSEEILTEKILDYAKRQNYTKYTSTLKEAWRVSIAGLSKSLADVIDKSSSIPEISPDDDFIKIGFSKFGIAEARKHRSRGVTLNMFLGLMKYYRQSYADLLSESNFSPKEKTYFNQYVKRFFDHVELSFTIEWAEISEKTRLEELQIANREMTNEKNKYLTVFESIYDPIILVDENNNIENINYTASKLFLDGAVSGMKYYSNTDTDKEFGWLNNELNSFICSGKNQDLYEKNIKVKDSQRIFLIKFKKMLDISEKYRGTVIIIHDITERVKIEKELILQRDKLKFYAFTDPMTGVSNRRTGLMILERELSIVASQGTPLSVCFIDVDCLKVINDTYGHAEGDFTINSVVSSIKSSVKETDTIVRMGGDEFLIIFPNCHEASAKKVVEKIYDDLENYNKKSKKSFKYSFSYGIVEAVNDSKLCADDIIKAADEKMYKNKIAKKIERK